MIFFGELSEQFDFVERLFFLFKNAAQHVCCGEDRQFVVADHLRSTDDFPSGFASVDQLVGQ